MIISQYDTPTTAPLLFKRCDNVLINEFLVQQGQADPAEKKQPKFLLCINCLHRITSQQHLTDVNGKQVHTFTNPGGIQYTIGCFTVADGCLKHGNSTFEYTWFREYAWNYAMCSDCLQRLGWHFSSSDNKTFFGLILKFLIEENRG